MTDHSSGLPLVSIVIPAYNAAEYLCEAIDSVLDQSYPNIELIVLDDGSTDGTSEILKRYPEGDFYRESHPNMGQAATLNKGWAMSKGEFLGYLSADDTLLPDAVEMLVGYFDQDSSVAMVYCDYEYMDQNSSALKTIRLPEFSYSEMILKILCIPGPGALWRRTAFEKCGGWDESLRQLPDYEFWLRLSLYGSFYHVPNSLARFRVHTGSQTYSAADTKKSEEIISVMKGYFQRPDLPQNIQRYRAVAMANAHIFSAALHFRAGRYAVACRHLSEAFGCSPQSLLSVQSFKRLFGGVWFHVRR